MVHANTAKIWGYKTPALGVVAGPDPKGINPGVVSVKLDEGPSIFETEGISYKRLEILDTPPEDPTTKEDWKKAFYAAQAFIDSYVDDSDMSSIVCDKYDAYIKARNLVDSPKKNEEDQKVDTPKA